MEQHDRHSVSHRQAVGLVGLGVAAARPATSGKNSKVTTAARAHDYRRKAAPRFATSLKRAAAGDTPTDHHQNEYGVSDKLATGVAALRFSELVATGLPTYLPARRGDAQPVNNVPRRSLYGCDYPFDAGSPRSF